MDRKQIEALAVGMWIEQTFDTVRGQLIAAPAARWSEPREIVEITYRGVSDQGRAYVGGYVQWGPNARLSFSISEGETFMRAADMSPRSNVGDFLRAVIS